MCDLIHPGIAAVTLEHLGYDFTSARNMIAQAIKVQKLDAVIAQVTADPEGWDMMAAIAEDWATLGTMPPWQMPPRPT